MSMSFPIITDICPGDCIADRIAQYCEAYYKTPKSCGAGKKCCVTKDTQYSIDEIIIPHSENGSESIHPTTTITSVGIPSSTNNKYKTNNKNKKSSTSKPLIVPESQNAEKKCHGECVAGLFALFCDDIDSDATCPGEASCCVKSDSFDSNTVEETTTTVKPMKNKPTTNLNKVRNTTNINP